MIFFAQATFFTNAAAPLLPGAAKPSPSELHDTSRLFALLGLLAVALFLAVLLFRKKKPAGLQRSAWPASASKNQPIHIREKKVRRKRRREHRPTNPTLAKTGGLPPKRDEPETPTV